MPEDIEAKLVKLINGTFYTNRESETACAVWRQSDAFKYEMPANVGGNTAPEVFGVTVTFDILQFPLQLTSDPDPIQSLNNWTKQYFSQMVVIAHDKLPEVFIPSDESPAIYWRFDDTVGTDKQTFAVNWYLGQFAAHIIAGSLAERNRWMKAIVERIQIDGEVLLVDESPMFAKRIAIRPSADPLREGQLLLTGQYGVLATQRKLFIEPKMQEIHVGGLGASIQIRTEENTNGE
jgi:hypothetical protein